MSVKKYAFLTLIALLTLVQKIKAQNTDAASTPSTDATTPTNTTTQRVGRPDLPGTLRIEVGLNFTPIQPAQFKLKNFGSKTFNAYYLYDFPIKESHFAFSAGAGISVQRYSIDGTNVVTDKGTSLEFQDFFATRPNTNLRRNKFTTTFAEIPIEFSYHGNKSDHRQGFFASVGAKVGYFVTAKTKLKYRENGQNIIEKYSGDFELNKLRYSVNARIGFSAIQLYGQYELSTLFRKDTGLDFDNTNVITAGISLRIF